MYAIVYLPTSDICLIKDVDHSHYQLIHFNKETLVDHLADNDFIFNTINKIPVSVSMHTWIPPERIIPKYLFEVVKMEVDDKCIL
jgi:hypothetical protein